MVQSEGLPETFVDATDIEEQGKERFLDYSEVIPSSKTNRIYIRKAYDKLYTLCLGKNRSLLLGTPGVGKSMAVYYFVWKLLKSKPDVTIVLKNSDEEYAVYIKEAGTLISTTVFENGIVSSLNLFDSPNTYYFYDGFRPDKIGHIVGNICLCSSPRREVWGQYKKYEVPTTFYMPVFSKEELIVCQNHVYRMDNDRKQLLLAQYAKWGGSARILFRCLSNVDQDELEENLQKQMSDYNLYQGLIDAFSSTGGMVISAGSTGNSARGTGNSARGTGNRAGGTGNSGRGTGNRAGMKNRNLYPEASCYLVFHLIPDDDDFTKRRVVFASKYVEFEAKNALFQKKWQETSLLTSALAVAHGNRSFTGVLFEQRCFSEYFLFPEDSENKEMKIDLFQWKLNNRRVITNDVRARVSRAERVIETTPIALDRPKRTLKYFTAVDLKALLSGQFKQDTHVVFRPRTPNFASIDAITVDVEGDKRIIYIWQVTIQSPNDHGLVRSGLDIAKRCCDAAEIRLVWVLNNIDGSLPHLTRPDILDSKTYIPDFQLGIKQYVAFLYEPLLDLTSGDANEDIDFAVPPEPINVPETAPSNVQSIVPADTSANARQRDVSRGRRGQASQNITAENSSKRAKK